MFSKLRFLIVLAIVVVSMMGALAVAEENPEIGIMVYRDNPGQHEPTIELVNQWAKEKGVKVNITIAGHSDRQTVVTTTLEAGSGPDILFFADFEPHLYIDALMDVSDLARDIAEENGGWFPIAEIIGKAGEEWKALPIYIYMHQMIYRKDIIEKAGTEVPQTWEGFRIVLQKIKELDVDIEPFGVAFGRSFDGQQFLISVILANGGRVLSPDGSEVVFDSPETVEALKYVIDIYQDGLVDPTVVGWDDSTNNQAILAGRIAFTFNGFSIKMQAEKDFPDLNPNIGAAVYPGGTVTRASFPFTLSLGIRKDTQHPELAKDLVRYLFKRENYEKVLEHTRGSVGVSLQGFAELPIWDDPDYRANLDAIPTAQLFASPSRHTAEVWNGYVIIDMLGDVLVRGMTPEEAVEKAAKQMEEIYFGGK